jgi:hypothetical protein
MTETEFESAMNRYELDDQYSDYLMNHTDARIGNGTMLINVMERGDYYDDFKDFMTGEKE